MALEATWGADPIESIGGFQSLAVDEHATFKSSLAPSGQVSWSRHAANHADELATTYFPSTDSAAARLNVNFPQIEWASLQSVYGWAALQVWSKNAYDLHINPAAFYFIALLSV